MGEIIFKFDCEVTYEPGKEIEVHLKNGGSLSSEVTQHLAQAGRELSLVLKHLAKVEAERTPEKVRTKIEIEET